MSDCAFCEIVAGEQSAHRLHEDDRTLAFLDDAPAATGHALVVPKAHHETLTDMPGDLASAVFWTVRRVAAAVEDALDPAGVSVLQQNGVAAGQDVPHAHVHVVPRDEDDDVRLAWPGDGEANAETARRLRERV
ncbi:histidine triad nucleotide-binding protein [Halarchaeum acidiphilum MH1-52-1]|uniref:Histidine triad nucleotide-binding protein n=3 Tax=Halarchaeum acidiphilum TaxID=489138 RepID=U2YD55_9EURY|nr:HIT domain-containing protein [Halarchaeum acidiphilum]GAD51586.1 histidine triad nucleotide-binding protein [Halarchaeum acidiphilum MH1-52-1]